MKDFSVKSEEEKLNTKECKETGIITCLNFYLNKTKNPRKAAFIAECIFGAECEKVIRQWLEAYGKSIL